MVGEVVAGEGVDQIGVARHVGIRDRHDLAITRGVRQSGSALDEVGRIRCEECRRHQGRHVAAVVSACDDLGDGGRVADRELMDDVVGIGGHECSIDFSPDTALTREIGRTVR